MVRKDGKVTTSAQGSKQRDELAKIALNDAMNWFVQQKGLIAIYDGTNSTRDRRQKLLQLLEQYQSRYHLVVKAIFIEIICTDPSGSFFNHSIKILFSI